MSTSRFVSRRLFDLVSYYFIAQQNYKFEFLLQTIESMMEMIQIGLKSTNAFVRACTINFITLAFLELKPKEPNAILIQACIDQIVESKQTEAKPAADGSQRKEALGFISLNLSLFKSLMGPYTGAIGQVLSLPGNPRQEVNKILARMIKVFGVAGLRAVLPTANEPKMHIRIRNLQKKIRKMQEAKKLGKKSRDDGDEDDEDREDKSGDESDEDELVGTAKTSRRTLSKRGLIMKEGVVDFLDPKTVTGAVISELYWVFLKCSSLLSFSTFSLLYGLESKTF